MDELWVAEPHRSAAVEKHVLTNTNNNDVVAMGAARAWDETFVMFRDDGQLYQIVELGADFELKPVHDALPIDGDGDIAAGPDPQSLWLLRSQPVDGSGVAQLLALAGNPTTPTLTFTWGLTDTMPSGMATRGGEDLFVSAGVEVGILDNMGGGYGVLESGVALGEGAGRDHRPRRGVLQAGGL